MNNRQFVTVPCYSRIIQSMKRLANAAGLRNIALFQVILACCCVVMLNGCMKVGPDFQKPEIELPDDWSETGIDAATQSSSADEEGLAEWWTVFQDDMLTTLIEKAVINNFDIQLAASRINQARAERGHAISGLGPTINGTGGYTRSQTTFDSITLETSEATTGQNPPSEPSAPSGTGQQSQTSTPSLVIEPESIVRDQFNVGFDASWELDIFGGVRRKIEAAEADLDSAIEAKRTVHITLAAEVAREYVELRALQLRRKIARKNLQAQAHTGELTRQKHDGGFANGLDVAYADAQTATTKSTIPQLEAASLQKIYSLSVLIGLNPTALIEELSPIENIPSAVEDIPTVEFSQIVPVGVPSDLLLRRPDIRRLEAKIHSATASIGIAESDLFPKFYINGSSANQSDATDILFSSTSWVWSIGPSFRWNVFNTGKTKANIAIQETLTEQSVLEYQHTVFRALQEVENALIASKKEKEHFQALATAVQANRKAVQLATALYQGGEIDFLEVLVAQRSLFLAEDTWAQSRERLSTNLIALYKAIGGGWDVEKNMDKVQ